MQVTEQGLRFSSTYDNMPAVPRPLPPEYLYISETAMLEEAKAVAPYHETGQVNC